MMLIQKLTLSLKNHANLYPKQDLKPIISVYFNFVFLQANSIATDANYGVGLIFCILQSAHPPGLATYILNMEYFDSTYWTKRCFHFSSFRCQQVNWKVQVHPGSHLHQLYQWHQQLGGHHPVQHLIMTQVHLHQYLLLLGLSVVGARILLIKENSTHLHICV